MVRIYYIRNGELKHTNYYAMSCTVALYDVLGI